MTGIQVHTSSPINSNTPTKAEDSTAGPTTISSAPAYNLASTTTQSHPESSQSAQPGGAAFPKPSAAATAYSPQSPTKTTVPTTSTNPPPPQPGQFPGPHLKSDSTNIPPPPTVSAVPRPFQPYDSSSQVSDTQSRHHDPPPIPSVQWSPSYAYAQPPSGVTSATMDLSHPPGYIQDKESFDDRYLPQEMSNRTPIAGKGQGLLEGSPQFHNSDEDGNPIWDTAVSWAKGAGRKLSAVEDEVWKKINGGK